MPTIYIETSIVSYLRQRPNTQVVTSSHVLFFRATRFSTHFTSRLRLIIG